MSVLIYVLSSDYCNINSIAQGAQADHIRPWKVLCLFVSLIFKAIRKGLIFRISSIGLILDSTYVFYYSGQVFFREIRNILESANKCGGN